MRRTKAEAEETRQTILRIALEVMVERGYSGAVLEEIAERAGLTRGAIYWHFTGKEAIYLELVDQMHTLITGVIDSALQAEGSALDRARNLTTRILENFFTNNLFRLFIELTWFKKEQDPTASDRSRQANLRVISEYERLIRIAISENWIRPGVNAENAALQIDCLISGIYRLAILIGPEKMNLESALAMVHAWWDALESTTRDHQR